MRKFVLPIVSALTLASSASASNRIYDFEQPWQSEDWVVTKPQQEKVCRSEKFATSGKYSLGFYAPASSTKPIFYSNIWENNWIFYDRLLLELTNPTDQEIRLVAFVGDENNGFSFNLVLPPLSYKQHVVTLKIPPFVRQGNILGITFTGETNKEINFYLDDITLLKKDEPVPASHEQKLGVELGVVRSQLAARKADEAKSYIRSLNLKLPAAEKQLMGEVESLRVQATQPNLTAEAQTKLINDLNRVQMSADRFKEVRGYVNQYKRNTSPGYVIGFADPMRKIMPKHLRTNLTISNDVKLSVAGNEKEAFQVAVVPFAKDAKQVTVSMSDLQGPNNSVLSKSNIDCDLMGYAETKMKTEPSVDYIGWYPDPIIQTKDAVDVRLGDVQSWWIRVRAPKGQTAGKYKGKLTVASQGQRPQLFDVEVEVYDFNVPPHAPIPTAITYVNKEWFVKDSAIKSRGDWEKLKYKHADFLADYYINYDSIYRPPTSTRIDSVDWELIKYLHDKGQLVAFCLGYFGTAKDEAIESFRPNYEKAKELGVLDHAYIYGYDEHPSSDYPAIEEACQKFKQRYPEVLVMTTAQDHSYGFDSPMKTLGGFIPIISRFNPTLAEKARQEGKEVWWYTCIWPPHPYPNIFVDYPAIDNRILTGLMTAQYKPDGFLYYHTTIWRTPEGINTYPYTNWDPNSYDKTNGDGSYFCIDKDGNPVATIRVENYRDGLEDLAYYMILEHKVKLAKAAAKPDQVWIAQATTALNGTSKYIRSRIDWTTNPRDVYEYRAQLAHLIENSPVKDDNPWKGGMGVRGLAATP